MKCNTFTFTACGAQIKNKMFIVRVNETSFSNVKERLIKFLGWGKNDVQIQKEAAPYGVDSNPIKGMVAIYAQTANGSESVVVGYINKNQLSEVGEHRIYSTNSDGELQASVWLKANGDTEIKAGDSNKVKINSGSSKAVLGDKTKDVLTDIVTVLTAINTWGETVTPPLPDQSSVIAQIYAGIPEIESENVTLD